MGKLKEFKRPVNKIYTSFSEGQVVGDQVCGEKILLEVLSYIGLVGSLTREGVSQFLVIEVEEPCVVVVRVGLEIK